MISLRSISSSAVASIYSVWFVVIITIWAELTPGLKIFLANITGHHWVSKGVLMAVVYAVFFVVYSSTNKNPQNADVQKYIRCLNWCAVAGAVVLTAFFIWHS